MDSLIVILLIIIGVAASSSKKKQAQKQRARQADCDESTAVPPPLMREEASVVKAPAAKQVKIPYTKDEWKQFLNEIEDPKPAKPAARPAAKPKPAPSGSLNVQDDMEGMHIDVAPAERLRPAEQHSEGESSAEHAAHRQRIAEEEARQNRERAELQELRAMNLKKLRSAVVMSEVLGKPVALRSRGR